MNVTIVFYHVLFFSHALQSHCCLVIQLCPTLCDSMNCSTPGFPVLQYLPEFAHTHVHWVSDAIQLSHPQLPPLLPPILPSIRVTLGSMWDLSSLTRNRTCGPCIAIWRLNHWTAREVSKKQFLMIDPYRTWDSEWIKRINWECCNKMLSIPSYFLCEQNSSVISLRHKIDEHDPWLTPAKSTNPQYWQTLFSWSLKSLQMVTAVMKLKDACSLEEKPWQT